MARLSAFIFIIASLTACASYALDTPVKPPKVPHISDELSDEEVEKLPLPKQPEALTKELMALTEGTVEERVAKLKKKVVKDLVFVKGGAFMMGDFGQLWSPEGLPYTSAMDNKPAHKVTLTSYSISRYKTTYAEFDVYTDVMGLPRAGMERHNGVWRHPLVPAGIYWQPAKDYCQWLGEITGLPFDLPTEAQWEYAARNRGQYFVFATDNGNLDIGRNIADSNQIISLTPIEDGSAYDLYPIAIFPPTPLGLYDLNQNGQEWTNDWYDPEYYRHSPIKDPKGPATGEKKVARGWPNGDSLVGGINMWRRARHPQLLRPNPFTDEIEPGAAASSSVRCAVNMPRPVKLGR